MSSSTPTKGGQGEEADTNSSGTPTAPSTTTTTAAAESATTTGTPTQASNSNQATLMETSPLVSNKNQSSSSSNNTNNDTTTTAVTSNATTTTATTSTTTDNTKHEEMELSPQDQKMIDCLKSHGMETAATELMQKLTQQQQEQRRQKDNEMDSDDPKQREQDNEKKEDSNYVTTTTTTTTTTTIMDDNENDNESNTALPAQAMMWGVPDDDAATLAQATPQRTEQVKTLLDAYCEWMVWVLQLPDTTATGTSTSTSTTNVADHVSDTNPATNDYGIIDTILDDDNDDEEAATASPAPLQATLLTTTNASQPPSIKPELMTVSFALFCYVYMEALEVGMETTARTLRTAFGPLFQALYPQDVRDLQECTTTQDILRLNTSCTQYRDSHNKLRAVADQLTKYHLRLEYSHSLHQHAPATPQDIKKLQMNTHLLLAEYQKRTLLSTQVLDKIQDLPFLQRAKSLRWCLNLSNTTYACLSEFLRHSTRQLQSLWTLLQTKCTLQIEDRDPQAHYDTAATSPGFDTSTTSSRLHETTPVHWGVPALVPEVHDADERIPFLDFELNPDGYDTEKEGKRAQRLINFNRSLMVHGFRRAEGLERKREYRLLSPLAQKRARRGEATSTIGSIHPWEEASILFTTLSASSAPVSLVNDLNKTGGDVLEARNTTHSASSSWDTISGAPSVWEEPGMGICAARASTLGECVAAGCDDAAVRIYNLESSSGGGGGEPCQVLLGHKEGLPVFDVDWNRNGRNLLSAGGDGTIRLWDTMAVGPFGELTTPKDDPPPSSKGGEKKKTQKGAAQQQQQQQSKAIRKEKTEDLSETTNTDMVVPGWRSSTEPVTYTSGAALAVYQTKHSDRPIWSVSFAPCGYYFCSAGADASARLWTTDRIEPIRLFSGHTSGNVNCIEWHPNASYVVTGGDDKTARLWDIHSGQTVRLLSGCRAGVNKVQISPGGRYCAGADYSGAIHLWDLGSGKKVSVLHPMDDESAPVSSFYVRDQTTVHAMSFSTGGDCLAVGSDDCTVRLWDVRTAVAARNNAKESLQTRPVKAFPTRRTVVMDLQYTKRNLLLAVGKYTSPVVVNYQ